MNFCNKICLQCKDLLIEVNNLWSLLSRIWLTTPTSFLFLDAHGMQDLLLISYNIIGQAPVVQKVDNAIHRITHYPADSVVCFVQTFSLDSDLPSGWLYPAFEQPGPGVHLWYLRVDMCWKLRLCSFGVIWVRISEPRSVWIMVHQRNRRIHSGHGFTGSFDASWSRQILDHWSGSGSSQRNAA